MLDPISPKTTAKEARRGSWRNLPIAWSWCGPATASAN